MKLRILLFISTLHFSLYAQKSEISIAVKDNATKKNIEWASLSINKAFFLSSDEEGGISFNSNLFKETDSITISAVGYISKNYIFKQLKEETAIIYLLQDVQVLNEVVVNPNKVKPERVVFGIIYKLFPIGTMLTNFNNKYAQYIPNKDGLNCQIKELEFSLGNNQKGIDQPFRVNIYTKNKNNNLPLEELIKDDLIVRNYDRKQKFKVDVSKYNIFTPKDGFFIVAETLNKEYYSNKTVNKHNLSFNRLPSFKIKYTKEPNGEYYNLIKDKSLEWYKNNKLWYTTFYFTAILSCQ
jgi:hypothetical protein